jgi:hypothetical protein
LLRGLLSRLHLLGSLDQLAGMPFPLSRTHALHVGQREAVTDEVVRLFKD